jgi:hypothetical protein
MIGAGIFAAGFASGWVARGSVDSSRGAVVAVVATYFKAVERMKRLVAIEREHLEDLIAEGRAKFENDRARSRARAKTVEEKAPRESSPRVVASEKAA